MGGVWTREGENGDGGGGGRTENRPFVRRVDTGSYEWLRLATSLGCCSELYVEASEGWFNSQFKLTAVNHALASASAPMSPLRGRGHSVPCCLIQA